MNINIKEKTIIINEAVSLDEIANLIDSFSKQALKEWKICPILNWTLTYPEPGITWEDYMKEKRSPIYDSTGTPQPIRFTIINSTSSGELEKLLTDHARKLES